MEACGGIGYFVWLPEELECATVGGFNTSVPVFINVTSQRGKVEKPVST